MTRLDGQNVVQEGPIDNNLFVPDVTYLTGPRGVEYRMDESTGTMRYYVYDGLGSVLAEVGEEDANHNPVKCTRKYDVYGAVRGSTGTSDSQHKFVGSLGHTTEPDTGGLIYMRARWMDPVTGRFVSEDRAYDGINWYLYCRNNPVNATDPDGRMAGLLVGGAEEMSMEARSAAQSMGVGAALIQSLTRSLLVHGATIYGALSEGGEKVMVKATQNGVALYNTAGNGVFIHLRNFHNRFGTGDFAHYDVTGGGIWKALMDAFERLPL